jgi:hypothetical protein
VAGVAEEVEKYSHSLSPSSNRFQKKQYAKIDIVKTEKKGFGVRALEDMPAFVPFPFLCPLPLIYLPRAHSDTFVYEYLGEVIGPQPFARKMKEYANEGIKHFYFMALDKDVVRLLSSPPLSSPALLLPMNH